MMSNCLIEQMKRVECRVYSTGSCEERKSKQWEARQTKQAIGLTLLSRHHHHHHCHHHGGGEGGNPETEGDSLACPGT